MNSPQEREYVLDDRNVIEWIIGDVHGCLTALLALEDRARNAIAARGLSTDRIPRFVLVGDLIDRGPDVESVLIHVREGVEAGSHHCVCGNHESVFLELADHFARGRLRQTLRRSPCFVPVEDQASLALGGAADKEALESLAAKTVEDWKNQGGQATLDALGLGPDPSTWDLTEGKAADWLAWIAALPLVYSSPAVTVTHALATADDVDWALAESKEATAVPEAATLEDSLQRRALLSTRRRHLEGLLWAREALSPWATDRPVHASGHTPLKECLWLEEGRRLLLDTGAVYGNRLSAWSPQLGSIITVPTET